jgi:hypothetical protein
LNAAAVTRNVNAESSGGHDNTPAVVDGTAAKGTDAV